MEPEDKLFATLDTTAHRGKLPCGVKFVCIDTVGFITDLPHELIKSFSSTLMDVKDAVSLSLSLFFLLFSIFEQCLEFFPPFTCSRNYVQDFEVANFVISGFHSSYFDVFN